MDTARSDSPSLWVGVDLGTYTVLKISLPGYPAADEAVPVSLGVGSRGLGVLLAAILEEV